MPKKELSIDKSKLQKNSKKKRGVKVKAIFTWILLIAILAGIFFTQTRKEDQNVPTGRVKYKREVDFSLKDKSSVYQFISDYQTYLDLSNNEQPLPTNNIWSSIVFNGSIEGLYTYPFASRTQNGQLQVTLPKKYVYEKMVSAQIISDYISIEASNKIDKVYVKDFSDISVRADFRDTEGNSLFEAQFIQGSPYIFITPKSELTIKGSNFNLMSKGGTNFFSYDEGNIGIFTNLEAKSSANEVHISPKDGGYITLGYFPDQEKMDLIEKYASNQINSVTHTFTKESDNFRTTFEFKFEEGKTAETIWGILPHQYINRTVNAKEVFMKNTLRGDMKFIEFKDKVSFSIEVLPMVYDIPILNYEQNEYEKLSKILEKDLSETTYLRESGYFGGNDVGKLARMIQISDQIGNKDLVNRIAKRLRSELENWYTYEGSEMNKYFAYDQNIGGLIAFEIGFGAEEFNDHHFQYGYFIYASSVLCHYDPTFCDEYGALVDQLVKDIANRARDDKDFPFMRYYDFYEGHSWATGFGIFTDGNNQESTSEAVNAWYSVWLWGEITGDEDLKDWASYLYANEVNSAMTYWFDKYDREDIFPEGYAYNKTSLLWGGKFEYQTFFSMDPGSIEGIQYLPFTGGSLYMYDREMLARDYAAADQIIERQQENLYDFNLMYYMMQEGSELADDRYVETMRVDQGNSRSNVQYWRDFWDEIREIRAYDANSYLVNYKSSVQRVLTNCGGWDSRLVTIQAYESGQACN